METNYSDHNLVTYQNNRNVYSMPGEGFYAVMCDFDSRYFAIPGSAFSPTFSTVDEALKWKAFPNK